MWLPGRSSVFGTVADIELILSEVCELVSCGLAMQALNPLLADEARKKLVEHMLLWQELCVLQDKLARCMLRCDVGAASQAGGMDASLGALEQELTNRREWSAAENPEWLAFEVLQRVEIRHRQYVVAKHMLENSGGPGMGEAKKGGIVQLNMGEGKTRVILPMLVLALSGRGQLVRLNFLQELLPEAVDYLHTCLTGLLLLSDFLTPHLRS